MYGVEKNSDSNDVDNESYDKERINYCTLKNAITLNSSHIFTHKYV